MNKTRCTCSVFVYNDFIYVIGGYTGEFQRSKKVTYIILKKLYLKKLNLKIRSNVTTSRKMSGNIWIGNFMLDLKMVM